MGKLCFQAFLGWLQEAVGTTLTLSVLHAASL